MEEIEKAHLDYERRRTETINRLNTIIEVYGVKFSPATIKWLKQAVEFIKEKEI